MSESKDEPGGSGINTVHALYKTNLLLETVVKKLDRQGQSISELAQAISVGQGNSTPTRKVSRQKEVPLQVRVSAWSFKLYSYSYIAAYLTLIISLLSCNDMYSARHTVCMHS